MPAPIRKALAVPLRPDAAFCLFAERLGDRWPPGPHSVSAAQGKLPSKASCRAGPR